jgi:hypothetical protein
MMIELTMVSSVFEKTVSLDLTISETSHVVIAFGWGLLWLIN